MSIMRRVGLGLTQRPFTRRMYSLQGKLPHVYHMQGRDTHMGKKNVDRERSRSKSNLEYHKPVASFFIPT